ncbi:MAG: helix-turn-helix domain-containing protein [Planctomycetia bacterium]|nr:helix-turn-helix domain-containing protein [Planctomycetia bacterium]
MKHVKEDKSVLNLDEASAYLGVSPETMRKYLKDKKVPHKKFGKRYIILKSALDKWLSE